MQTTLQALDDGRLHDRARAWVMTITITAIAFVLRFYNVAFPNKILFDETYYATDAAGPRTPAPRSRRATCRACSTLPPSWCTHRWARS